MTPLGRRTFFLPLVRLATFFAVCNTSADASADRAGSSTSANPQKTIDEVVAAVHNGFYDPDRIPAFDHAIAEYVQGRSRFDYKRALRAGLAALRTSHTELFEPDELDYYEVLAIYLEPVNEAAIARLFRKDNVVVYEGCGLVAKAFDHCWYVSEIYDAAAAASTPLGVGDRLIAVDGKPFEPIRSFRGRAGSTVTISASRSANGPVFNISMPVSKIRPLELLNASIKASVRGFRIDRKRIGYLHLWSYASDAVQALVQDVLTTESLSDVDGLVLDMRCRWGGAPPQAADIFIGTSPELELKGRGPETVYNFRYRKPLVGIIDEGTRSGMEVLAYSLQKANVPLVGSRTAGAVAGGGAQVLSDGSLLLLAVLGIKVNGHVLEGVGVEPDVMVEYDRPYSPGKDPQRQAAVNHMAGLLNTRTL